MRVRTILGMALLLFAPLVLPACDSTETPDRPTVRTDFQDGRQGWTPFFTNYGVDMGSAMEFESGLRPRPPSIRSDGDAFMLGASNRSDDVKMLLRRPVTGLSPNTTYRMSVAVSFASNSPTECVGIGGPPGEAVRVLADASAERPEQVVSDTDYYRLSTQVHAPSSQTWYQNAQLGHIGIDGLPCEEGAPYRVKTLASESSHDEVTADEEGQVWLMVGTRSGFEGRTELYWLRVEAAFEPV